MDISFRRLATQLLAVILAVAASSPACSQAIAATPNPERPPLVSLSDIDPTILFDIRYFGDHNFVGRPIRGYRAAKCLLTKQAAEALQGVQSELKKSRLSLKVYDCFRPQRAVDDFVAWAKDLAETRMKKEFYPFVDKANLFRDGYIAAKSGHSRGSTVDLTIVALPAAEEGIYKKNDELVECTRPIGERFRDNSLDMGTGYDCFDPMSHTLNPSLGSFQQSNRMRLTSMMDKYGFKNLADEWWHYTLKNEPYPKRYFDVDIE